MSSANEELAAPPKPRTSPFEVRNTELVSRLLAATPPYLYSMPLVPHSYFFSEMLRSLVQSKAEAAARMTSAAPHRRSRKRSWTQGRAEHYKEMNSDQQEMPPPTWTPPKEKRQMFERPPERPLELTMSKIPLNNNSKINTETSIDIKPNEHKIINTSSSTITSEKQEMIHSGNGHIPPNPMMFPTVPNLTPPDTHSPSSSSSSDLILPPPPPIWYPPLYPPPYGIDPLHFFIDLRVSGHIYDRKNAKEHMQMSPNSSQVGNPVLEIGNSSTSNFLESGYNIRDPLLKQTRHNSAFSVPTPSLSINDPLNLSGSKYQKPPRFGEDYQSERKGKFDIKSMGFDKNPSENTKSTNFIMKNILKIYKNAHDLKYNHEGMDLTSPKQEHKDKVEISVKEENTDQKEEDEKDSEKKCKDLRALIGLELVVDYVNHNVKPVKQSISEESSTDVDSRCSSSPAVEVVTIPDV